MQSTQHTKSLFRKLARRPVASLLTLALCAGALLAVSPARAQNTYFEPTGFPASFIGTNGQYPNSVLVFADGFYWGTTPEGGTSVSNTNTLGYGTLFKVTPAGVITVVHNFGDGSVANDGVGPGSLVLGADGNLYGTAESGGANGQSATSSGAIFKVVPSTGAYTIEASFGAGGADGAGPVGKMAEVSPGSFYGVTRYGGVTYQGTIFHFVAGTGETEVYNFLPNSNQYDASVPTDGLILGSDGNLYGTTSSGGTGGEGTVFEYVPGSPGTETVIHSFTGSATGVPPNETVTDPDGVSPEARLVEGSGGTLYGTTANGGKYYFSYPTNQGYDVSEGAGTVFSIALGGGSYKVLHDFGDPSTLNDGQVSYATLIVVDGNLYGTASGGGSEAPAASTGNGGGDGVVFEMTPAGAVTTLYNFYSVINQDGFVPRAGLTSDGSGNLYGTTDEGGSTFAYNGGIFTNYGDGTVFELSPTSGGGGSGGGTVLSPTTSATISPAIPNGSGGYYKSAVTVTITPSDPVYSGSNLTTYYTTDGTTPTTSSHPTTGTTAISLPFSTDGNYTVEYYSANTGGGTETVNTVTFKPDQTAPVTGATQTKVSTGEQVTLTELDNLSGTGATVYAIDGGTSQTYNGPFIVANTTAHTVTFYSTDVAGNVEAATSITVAAASGGGGGTGGGTTPTVLHPFAAGLQMISVTEDYSTVGLAAALSASNVKLAVWTGSDYAITPTAPADQLRPNVGYWVRFVAPTDLYDNGTHPAITPINLVKGWNMIGDPYNATIPLSTIQVNAGSSTYTGLAAASKAGVVALPIYTYTASPTSHPYTAISDSGSLSPYTGYWIYATEDCTLTIQVD